MFEFMCSNNPTHDVSGKKANAKCDICGGQVIGFDQMAVFIHNVKERALREAPRPGGKREPCQIRISLCVSCGAPIWIGGGKANGKEDEVVVEMPDKPSLCQNCEVVRFRHPEIFAWVTATTFWRANQMSILQRIAYESGRGQEETKRIVEKADKRSEGFSTKHPYPKPREVEAAQKRVFKTVKDEGDAEEGNVPSDPGSDDEPSSPPAA